MVQPEEGHVEIVEEVGERGEVAAARHEDGQEGRNNDEGSDDADERGCGRSDLPCVEVPEEDEKAGEKQNQRELQEDEQEGDDGADAPLDEVVEVVLAQPRVLAESAGPLRAVFVEPLLYHHSSCRGRKTAYET